MSCTVTICTLWSSNPKPILNFECCGIFSDCSFCYKYCSAPSVLQSEPKHVTVTVGSEVTGFKDILAVRRHRYVAEVNCCFLLQVLKEPRNALGKQYKKMFAMNNVSSLFQHVLNSHSSMLSKVNFCSYITRES